VSRKISDGSVFGSTGRRGTASSKATMPDKLWVETSALILAVPGEPNVHQDQARTALLGRTPSSPVSVSMIS
jgi:hypothetical protein